jgi:murein DD-endopeptidase MepM/ murein hydrolase activator NlpD
LLLIVVAAAACRGSGATPADAGAPVVQPPPPPPPPDPLAELKSAGLQRAAVVIDGPLEMALRTQVAPEVAAPLTQVTARLLRWWVDVPRELLRGDRVEVLYQLIPGKEPLDHAVRFFSTRDQQEHRAYLYKPEGSAWTRYYQDSGEELERRLKGGPLDDWEQITSMLNDGRHHKGVDFKVPVHTPVKLTFDGTLVRKNWNFRGNGNSLDFETADGRHVIYLHLEVHPKGTEVGKHFHAGDVVAQSGNTGHSFAPHLHYQLEGPNKKILDPFREHETYRVKLPDASMPAFQAARARLDSLLDLKAAPAAPVAAAAPAAGAPAPAAVPAAAPAAAPAAGPAAVQMH